MDTRALRLRIVEFERIQNRTAEEESELKQLRRRLARLAEDEPQRIVCDHPNAKCGDRFCRNCGEAINMPPKSAISEIVREILRDEYHVQDDQDRNDSNFSKCDDTETSRCSVGSV